jgi:hypothetical protein
MDALLDFAACMREHGVDMPDPQPAGGGGAAFTIRVGGDDASSPLAPDDDTFLEAEAACRGHLEALDAPDQDPQREAELVDAFLEFAECMRENGVDMPDPIVGGGNIRIRISGDDQALDPFSTEFQAAREACQDVDPLDGSGILSSGAG